MKRLFLILLSAALLAAGCEKTPPAVEERHSLSVSPAELNFSSAETASLTLNVSSDTKWTVSVANGGSWCSISTFSGERNGTVSVTAAANKTTSPRSTTITFSASKCDPVSVSVNQVAGKEEDKTETVTLSANPRTWDGQKRADVTYQVNVYSFADSDGDGWGDLKGVTQHLDYFETLGVSALWLSPIQESMSYHGYDVTDYTKINPKLGTEADFKDLIAKAKAKGIDIYMDYVLNHSGKGHPWFKQALADPSSKYRDYYFISANPKADYTKYPMLKGTTYQAGEWKPVSSGSPKITISKTSEAVTTGTSDWNLWFWQGDSSQAVRFKEKGDGTYYLVMNISGSCGMLVRKYMNWDAGSKFGASGSGTLTEGKEMELVGDGGDISFSGSGRYKIELSNVSTETLYYMGCFSDWMPDLNYGDPAQAETNPCFIDLAASADKWINLGVNGLRLDAVKHICGGISSFNDKANQTLLKKWYDHCNATYKARGGEGDFYIVAESWCDTAEQMAPYYSAVPSNFNFYFWFTLRDRIGKKQGNDFAKTVLYFRDLFGKQRSGFIDAIKLSNHDEDRAAENLGRSLEKEKLAAAVLLTSPGKPYVYQGEELGYWGTKSGGDEYVRTPIKWTKTGTVPTKALGDKVDTQMLSASISVEAQDADANSLLRTYKAFSQLRNNYPALASGTMTEHGTVNSTYTRAKSLAAWYLTSGTQKLLVVHNFSDARAAASFGTEDITRPVGLSGSAELRTTTSAGAVTDRTLTLGAWSSVVFVLSE